LATLPLALEPCEPRFLLASTLRGFVWNDLDGDGVKETGEPALAGWTVYLDANHNNHLDTSERTTTSGTDGAYVFDNLAAGNYLIGMVQKTGWRQTFPFAPPTGGAALVTGPAAPDDAMTAGLNLARQYDPALLDSAQGWVVGLSANTSIASVLSATGASGATPVASLPGAYTLLFPAGASGAQEAAHIAQTAGLAYAYPLIPRQQLPRFIPNDPDFDQQWYLRNTGQQGGLPGADLDVTPVWDSYLGNNVVVAVVDEGVDFRHLDLLPNYDAADSYDFNGGDTDPTPRDEDAHGTAVAGIIAGRGNNQIGISGVAPQSRLAAIRLTASSTNDALEAAGLSFDRQNIAIYNNSWGPDDDGTHLEGPGIQTIAALRDGVTVGRAGKGNIFVWAAGNGLEENDNVNYDGYANSRYVIAVTALDDHDVQAYYAEPGAPILVSAYGSGVSPGIFTTDNRGDNGYSLTDYEDDFGGTSASTPMVSGVVALMLQANPSLTWRDVKHILVDTARRNDPTDDDWMRNGAGHWVNHKYGYGSVDAAAAVQAASTWKNVLPETSATSGQINVGLQIPDDSTNGLVSSVTIDRLMRVETVEVVFSATHDDRGDLRVVLTSPDGTQSILAEPHSDTHGDYRSWTFTTNRHWDEIAKGTWTLRVTDEKGGEVGAWNSWKLNIYGTPVVGEHYVALPANATIANLNFANRPLGGARVTVAAFPFGSAPQRLLFTFDQDVASSISADDLELHNDTTGQVIPTAAIHLEYTASTHASVWTFPGFPRGLLPDGNYTARLKSAQITTAAGNMLDGNGDGIGGDDFAFTFFQLRGDANHDRKVDAADKKIVLANVNRIATNATIDQGDFNSDGRVDFADYQILELSFRHVLPPPTQPAPAEPMATTVFEETAPSLLSAPPAPVMRPRPVAPPIFSTHPIARRRD
jgi:subtilisin-like proprotein convertase family protein